MKQQIGGRNMQLLKLSRHILATTSLVGLMASQALAGQCLTQIRNFPGNGSNDLMNMTCEHFFAGVTAGSASAQADALGNKTVRGEKTAGGAGLKVISQGLDNAGNITCSSEDSSASTGAPVIANCSAATTRFRGVFQYAD
jgi:hypothetical protein